MSPALPACSPASYRPQLRRCRTVTIRQSCPMMRRASVKPPPTLIEGDAVAEFMAAHEKMVDETMEVRLTDWADHDFAALMIPLCRGAIDLARVQLAHGMDPGARRFAEDLIAQQLASIDTLLKWLEVNVAYQLASETSASRPPSDRGASLPRQRLAEPKGGHGP